MAEDIAFQRFLLGEYTPIDRPLLDSFRGLAQQYKFKEGHLHRLTHSGWRQYPTPASRLLILEEMHLRYMHTGAPCLYHLLRATYWWPHMEESCTTYVTTCFPCQLEKYRHHSRHGW